LLFFPVPQRQHRCQSTFESPCERRDNHGKHRWSVKNDPSLPPADANAIQAVTPSDIYSWPGPDERLTQQSERTGIENKWFALTGRVVGLKVETDGDLLTLFTDHRSLGSLRAAKMSNALAPNWRR
jgi:hypothetical protein